MVDNVVDQNVEDLYMLRLRLLSSGRKEDTLVLSVWKD